MSSYDDDDGGHYSMYANKQRDTKAAEILREFVRDLLINSTYFSEEDKKKKRHIIEREFKASDDRLNKLVLENSDTLIEAGQKFSQIQTILKSNYETTKTLKSWLASTGNPANWRVDDLKQLWAQSTELKAELDFIRCVETTKNLPFEVASYIKSKQYLHAAAEISNSMRLLNHGQLRGVYALSQVSSDLAKQRQNLRDLMYRELDAYLYKHSLKNITSTKRRNISDESTASTTIVTVTPLLLVECLADLNELKEAMHEVYLGLNAKIHQVVERCTENQYTKHLYDLPDNKAGSSSRGAERVLSSTSTTKSELLLRELFETIVDQLICIADAHENVLNEVERITSRHHGASTTSTVVVVSPMPNHLSSFYSMQDVWHVIQQQMQLLSEKYLGFAVSSTVIDNNAAGAPPFESIAARIHKRAADIWSSTRRRSSRRPIAQAMFSFNNTAHSKILQEHKNEQRMKRFAEHAAATAGRRNIDNDDEKQQQQQHSSVTTTPSGPTPASATAAAAAAASSDTTPDLLNTAAPQEEKLLCRPSAAHVVTLHAPLMRLCDRIGNSQLNGKPTRRSASPADASGGGGGGQNSSVVKRAVYAAGAAAPKYDSVETFDSTTTVQQLNVPGATSSTTAAAAFNSNNNDDSSDNMLKLFLDNAVHKKFLPELERSLRESLDRQLEYRMEQTQIVHIKRQQQQRYGGNDGNNVDDAVIGTLQFTVPVIEYFCQFFKVCEQLVELVYRLHTHTDDIVTIIVALLKQFISTVKTYYRRITTNVNNTAVNDRGSASPSGAAGSGTLLSVAWSEDDDVCRLLSSNVQCWFYSQSVFLQQQHRQQQQLTAATAPMLSFNEAAIYHVFRAAAAPLQIATTPPSTNSTSATAATGSSNLREVDIFLKNLAGAADPPVGVDDVCQDRRVLRTVASQQESADWLATELAALFTTLPRSSSSSTSSSTIQSVSLEQLQQLRLQLVDISHNLSEKLYTFLFIEVRMQTLSGMQYLFQQQQQNIVGSDDAEAIDNISAQLSVQHWNYAANLTGGGASSGGSSSRMAVDKVASLFRTLPQFIGDMCIELSCTRWRRVDSKCAKALQRMLFSVGGQLQKITEQQQQQQSSPTKSSASPTKIVDSSPLKDTTTSTAVLLLGIEHARKYFAVLQHMQHPSQLLERLEQEKVLRFSEREYMTLLKLLHRQVSSSSDNAAAGDSAVTQKRPLNLEQDLAALSILLQKYRVVGLVPHAPPTQSTTTRTTTTTTTTIRGGGAGDLLKKSNNNSPSRLREPSSTSTAAALTTSTTTIKQSTQSNTSISSRVKAKNAVQNR